MELIIITLFIKSMDERPFPFLSRFTENSPQQMEATWLLNEGVRGIRPRVTFDVMCNSPYVL